MQIRGGGVSTLVPHDRLKMFCQLGNPWILQVASLNTGTVAQKRMSNLLLDAWFWEDSLEDGSHDGVDITAGEGGSCCEI